jgi:hypothetical protein
VDFPALSLLNGPFTAAPGCETRLGKNACDEQVISPALEQTTRPASLDGFPMFALAYSGFPVELAGVGELHAAFLNESRTRIRWWSPVQEIRIHGPKKTGRSPFQRFCYAVKKTAAKSKNRRAWSESI